MQKPRLLLVDDDIDFLASTKKEFSPVFEITIVDNIKDAKQKIKQEDFDLHLFDLLLDAVSPQSGYKLIEYSKKIKPYTPIVVVTEHNKSEPTKKVMQMGVADYLIKRDGDLEDWKNQISYYIQRRSVFVSHSSKDKPFVEKLMNELSHPNISFFYDKEHMKRGGISKQLKKGITNCDLFMIIISKNAAKSDWVDSELNYAKDILSSKDSIIPVILEMPKGGVDVILSGLNRVNFYQIPKLFKWYESDKIKSEFKVKCKKLKKLILE